MAKKNKSAAAFKFQPFSRKQKKLLTWWTPASPYHNHDMIICDGSIRAGKTVAMIDSFIMWSTSSFENQSFIIAGKSMGALKRNVLKPMFQILAAKGIPYRYHRSENYIEIGSNVYYCFGANHEASQDVLQGMTAAGAYADEVALFPESFVDQMIGRCSVEGSKIWMNCNPGGPFHFVKTEYIDKAEEKRIFHLHFNLDDNPSLSEKVKERYKRMFSGVFYKRYILGLWVQAEGVIYDMFSEDKHLFTQWPDKIDEYQIWCDYGTHNPCVFLLVGKERGPRYWVLKEYYYNSRETGRQKTDRQYCEDLLNFVGDKPISRVIVDPSAASFITELQQNTRFPIVQANNDVLDGIRETAKALENGQLMIHESCHNIRREFSSYVWDEKAQKRGEDKPLKENDHALDAARYGIMTQGGGGIRVIEWEDEEDDDD